MDQPAFLPNNDSTRMIRSGSLYDQGINPNLNLEGQNGLYPQEVLAQDSYRQVEGEGEAELYISGLTSQSLLTSLPMNDSLTPLLERYINGSVETPSRRDMTGEWRGSSLDELIAGRKWRSVAKYCQDCILNSDPGRTSYLLAHWSLRLYALTQIELIQHLSTELSSLFALLPPSNYHSPPFGSEEPLFHPIAPFSFHMLKATLPGMKGDKETSIEELGDLIQSSKVEMWRYKKAGNGELEKVWHERVVRLGLMMSTLLVEIKASSSAASILSSYSNLSSSSELLASLCRLYISTGDITSYLQIIRSLEKIPDSKSTVLKTKALGLIANAEWSSAESIYRELITVDQGDGESINNLAVALLFQSRLHEAISTLTNLLKVHPRIGYSSETVLFNLATLTELRTDTAPGIKVGLLKSIVENGAEGLKSGCLKLAV